MQLPISQEVPLLSEWGSRAKNTPAPATLSPAISSAGASHYGAERRCGGAVRLLNQDGSAGVWAGGRARAVFPAASL